MGGGEQVKKRKGKRRLEVRRNAGTEGAGDVACGDPFLLNHPRAGDGRHHWNVTGGV